eukprot:167671_1
MSTFSVGIVLMLLVILSNTQWYSSVTKMPRVESRMAIGYYNNSIFLVGGYQMWRYQWTQFDIQSQKFVANKSIALAEQTWGTGQFYIQIDNKLLTIDVGHTYFNVFFLNNQTFIKNWFNPGWGSDVGSSACVAYEYPYIFIIGGDSPVYGILNTLKGYNMLTHTIYASLDTLQTERSQLSCITHSSILYAIAGQDNSYTHLNTIEKLNFSVPINQTSWSNNAQVLSQAVVGSRAVKFKDYILVIGGKNNIHIQTINTINGVVDLLPLPLANSVYYTAPIIINHVIYAFGGTDDNDNIIDYWQYGIGVLPQTNNPTKSPTLNPTMFPTFGPTTHIPTTNNPTTSSPTTNNPTTNIPTTNIPTTIMPTDGSSAPTITFQPTLLTEISTTFRSSIITMTETEPDGTSISGSNVDSDLEQLLFMILIIMLIIFAVVGIFGIVYSYKYQRNVLYKLKILNLVVFVFYVLDFVTDTFFAVSCYNSFSNNNNVSYAIIFFLSLAFIIFPSAVNLIMLNKNIKQWIGDKSNGKKIAKWIDSYLSLLFIVCFIVGNSKSAIKLFTSHLFGLHIFSLQLKPSQTMQLANEHVIISFFENVPQICLQIAFVLQSNSIRHISDVVIVALLCNVCGTIINCISLFTRKNILRTHGSTFDEDHMHMSLVGDNLTDSLL